MKLEIPNSFFTKYSFFRELNFTLFIQSYFLYFTDTPELIFLHTVPGAESKGINMTTIYFTQCEPSWTHKYEVLLIVARVLTLYLIPLAFMSLAYYKIVRVLFWSSANFLGRSDTAPMNNINSHTNSSYYHPQQQHNYQHNNHNGNNNAHYNSPGKIY